MLSKKVFHPLTSILNINNVDAKDDAEERPFEEMKNKTSDKLPLREATKVYISSSDIKPLCRQHAWE